jgi:membrane protein implicated in regulation of membrane protease activity
MERFSFVHHLAFIVHHCFSSSFRGNRKLSDEVTIFVWTILGIALIVAEVFTTGFVLLWFGVGALIAALCALLGFGMATQFLVFFITSIALTVASRTIFAAHFSPQKTKTLKTGVDALPGKVGTVVHSSQGALNEGAVRVLGSTWTAYPAEGETPLEAGDCVVVERVQGASIYVRRIGAEPDWRAPQSLPPSSTEKE